MEEIYIKTPKLFATGVYENKSFTILKGSTAKLEIGNSLPESSLKVRESLIESGVLAKKNGVLIFREDFCCKSPSEASNLITGTSSNGLLLWRDKNGRSLRSKIER